MVEQDLRTTSKRQRVAPALPTREDLFVPHLPGLNNASRLSIYAGNLPSTEATSLSDAHLYFLLTMNRHVPDKERLVIWMNGGPGCSSFEGSMMELGPLRVQKDGSVLEVGGSAWNEYANVLFLDQPAGTGYSYVTKHDDVRELAEAANHVVRFLANLYEIFPEFATMDTDKYYGLQTYLAGESFAGQYIPYIADKILESQIISTRLKGLLIGNGWISPREQFPAYLEYLLARGIVKAGSESYQSIKESTDTCLSRIQEMDRERKGSKGLIRLDVCDEIMDVINNSTLNDAGMCLNPFDTTLYNTCGVYDWPATTKDVTAYLRRPDVVKALHAEAPVPRQWDDCSDTVWKHFGAPNSEPSVVFLPSLLTKVPILLFAGENDLVCAGVGIERMIEKLEWNGAVGFGNASVLDWTVDWVPAGQWTTARGLTYVNVYNASHMVPMDVPAASHDMLRSHLPSRSIFKGDC
ncbi:hypothetical protein RQP46_007238 [Phenoliferia psychrophenolica]